MYREITIIIVILLLIFIGNYITQKNTVKSVEIMTKELTELKIDLLNNKDDKQIEEKIEYIMKEWNRLNKILAYYIEHDELEKVETELTGVKANIEVDDYNCAIEELEKGIYILNHIKQKQALDFINIF